MKSKYTVPLAGFFLLGAFMISVPLISFAKENESNKGKNDDKNKQENHLQVKVPAKVAGNRSCLRAFGGFFGRGWFKDNSGSSIGQDCHFPFGIGGHFKGDHSTTTPDVTAPVISNLISKPARQQAEVKWNTDEKSDSTLFWSTTSTVDTSDSSANKVSQKALVKDHRLILRHLAANTTYYVIVRSKDAAGNSTLSGTISVTSKPVAPDNSAPVISSVVTLTGTTTIQVGWNTNENATGRVYYSTALPVNISTASFVDSSSATSSKNHLVSVTGLNPSTTYYLVAESTDGAGNVSTSATFTAVTKTGTVVTDTTAPVISAIASTVASSTITVNWTTDESATSKVFYSLLSPVDPNSSTTPYVSNLGLVTNHSMTLTGLATSTAYHIVIQSADASNNTASASEFGTTTLAI